MASSIGMSTATRTGVVAPARSHCPGGGGCQLIGEGVLLGDDDLAAHPADADVERVGVGDVHDDREEDAEPRREDRHLDAIELGVVEDDRGVVDAARERGGEEGEQRESSEGSGAHGCHLSVGRRAGDRKSE